MSNWPSYLMGFAKHAASMSKDETKVGAALVDPTRVVLLTAYNGPPRGVQDEPERLVRPEKYLWTSHAECNLVAFAARLGIRTNGCHVFVTHRPCSRCAQALIQAGVVSIHVGSGQTRMPEREFEVASKMFYESGVSVHAVEDDGDDERTRVLADAAKKAFTKAWGRPYPQALGARDYNHHLPEPWHFGY